VRGRDPAVADDADVEFFHFSFLVSKLREARVLEQASINAEPGKPGNSEFGTRNAELGRRKAELGIRNAERRTRNAELGNRKSEHV
jgi:hypothetical protein